MRRALAALAASAAILAAAAAPAPAAAQLRAFEFRLDNDQFGFTPPRDERWYTSGEFIRAAFRPAPDAADARLAAAWCARVLACDPGSTTLRVLSLGHTIHTPTVERGGVPQPHDRPFAAALWLGAGTVVAGTRTRQSLELRLGTVGPAALGEPVQNGIHRMLGQARVDGWGWQVRAQPLAELGWSRLARLALGAGGPDAVLRTAVLAGTPVTQAELGAMLRFGRRPAGPHWPGESFGVPEPDGWHAFVGVEGRAVLRDALIDGDTYAYASRVRREPFAGSAFVGASFGAWHDWHLDLAFALHSVPFDAPLEPSPRRPQRIGTIGLRWQPAR